MIHHRFLSTLSLRRATVLTAGPLCPPKNFYPRSPCAERRGLSCNGRRYYFISIHALLAESDVSSSAGRESDTFLSTLSLRRATSRPQRGPDLPGISIHALLAESDTTKFLKFSEITDFYPRSPCGERPFSACPSLQISCISIHALLAESDQAANVR